MSLLIIGQPLPISAEQSIITESECYACMGSDKSRRQTEQQALAEAKKNALERTLSYFKSETQVKGFLLEKDVIGADANATISIIKELDKARDKDASSGDCYRMSEDRKVMYGKD